MLTRSLARDDDDDVVRERERLREMSVCNVTKRHIDSNSSTILYLFAQIFRRSQSQSRPRPQTAYGIYLPKFKMVCVMCVWTEALKFIQLNKRVTCGIEMVSCRKLTVTDYSDYYYSS